MQKSVHIHRRSAVRRVAAVLVFCAGGAAHAVDYYAEPSITVGTEYQDNRLLTLQPHESVRGYSAAPRVELGVRDEAWDLRADLHGKRTRYDRESLDHDSFYGKLLWTQRTERSVWQLDATHAQDTLLTGERIDADTGLPAFGRERRTETLAPSWSRSLSQTTQTQWTYQNARVTYGDGAPVNLNDYRQEAGQAVLSHDWSPRTRWSLTLAASSFDVPATDFESRTLTASAGVSHRLTPLWRVGLSAGARRTTTRGTVCAESIIIVPFDPAAEPAILCQRFEEVSQTDHGVVFGLNAEREFPRSRLAAGLTREVKPSGSGTEIESDTATLAFDHQLRPSRLWASVAAGAARQRAISGDPLAVDRDYARVEPRLRWRLTQHLDVSAAYRYERQRYERNEQAATNRGVFLTLSYRLPSAPPGRRPMPPAGSYNP